MKRLITYLMIMLLISSLNARAQGTVNVHIEEVIFPATGTGAPTHLYGSQPHCPGDIVWYNVYCDHYDNFKTRVYVANGTVLDYKPNGSPSVLVSPTEVVLEPAFTSFGNSGGYDQALVKIAWTSSSGVVGNLRGVVYYHYLGTGPTQQAEGYFGQPLNDTAAPVPTKGTYTVCGTNTLTVEVAPQRGATSYTWYAQDNSVLVNGQSTFNGYTSTSTTVQVTLPAGASPTTYQMYVQSAGPCGSTPNAPFSIQVNCTAASPPNVSFVSNSSGTTCQPRYDVRAGSVIGATSYTATLHGPSLYEGSSLTVTPDPNAYYVTFPFAITGPIVGISASVTATSAGGVSQPFTTPAQDLAGGTCGYIAAPGGSTSAFLCPNPATDQVTLKGSIQDAQAAFYDGRGVCRKTMLMNGQANQIVVDLRELPSGIYHVRITAKGQVLQRTQLIVQH